MKGLRYQIKTATGTRCKEQRQYAAAAAQQRTGKYATPKPTSIQAGKTILRQKNQPVKQHANHAKHHAEHQIKPQRIERRGTQLTDGNHRLLAVKQAEHDARHNDAGKHRFNGDQAVTKLRAHLFNNKQDARQWCVKSRRQPGRRAGGQQRMPRFFTAHAQNIQHHAANVAAKLHRWPFAAQHHTGTQRAHAAKKLHRNYPPPAHRPQIFQRAFDLRNAGTRGFGCKAAHQKIARHRQQCGNGKGAEPEHPAIKIFWGKMRGSPVLHRVNRTVKSNAHQSHQRTNQRCAEQDRQWRFVALKQGTEHAVTGRQRLWNIHRLRRFTVHAFGFW